MLPETSSKKTETPSATDTTPRARDETKPPGAGRVQIVFHMIVACELGSKCKEEDKNNNNDLHLRASKSSSGSVAVAWVYGGNTQQTHARIDVHHLLAERRT